MYQPLYARPLSEDERSQLGSRIKSAGKEEARRAEAILLSAAGKSAAEVASTLGFHPSNVKKWIKKFNEEGMSAIAPRKRGPREGPRPSFSPGQVEKLIALASSSPREMGYGFDQWTAGKLAAAAVECGIVDRISNVTIRQILKRQPSPKETSAFDLPAPEQFAALADDALKNSQFERAASLLAQAIEGPAASLEFEAELRVKLSRALEELSRYEDAYKAIAKFEGPQATGALPPRLRSRVRLRVGWAHSWLRDYPKAIASLNDARKSFLELQDDAGLSEAHYALARTYVAISEFRIARDHLFQALDSLKSPGHTELLAKIHFMLGTVDFYEGEGTFPRAKAKSSYLKALKLAELTTNDNLKGMILLNLGSSCDDDDPLGRDEAVHYYKRAIAILSVRGHRDLPLAYNNLGDNLRHTGSWTEALEALGKAVETSQNSNQPTWEATARVTMAEVLWHMGAAAEAERHIVEALELATSNADRWLESYALRVLASVCMGTGRVDEALDALRQSLRVTTAVGDLHGITLAQVALAEAHFLQGGLDQAGEYLELAQGRMREEKSKPLFITGLIQRLVGMIEASSGRFAVAKQHIAQSISIFSTTRFNFELGRSHLAMGEMLMQATEYQSARTHLADAAGIFEQLGAKPWIGAAQVALTALAAADEGASPSQPAWTPSRGSKGGAPSRTATGESAAASLARYEIQAPNDVLLMQRLIEASASKDLLVKELCSVLYENFDVGQVAVFRAAETGRAELLAGQGVAADDLDRLCLLLEQGEHLPGGAFDGGFLAHLASGSEAGSGRAGRSTPIFLFIRPRPGTPLSQAEHARLQPLVRQAELALEACFLRDAAAMPAPSRFDQQVRAVMPGFIVGSALMFEVLEKIHKIRTSDVTVLITGESGTGKELVARALHAESARARAIFLPFNCTATPRDLIESQLFGHRRGAFTGATANYPGMVRAAEGGTLFLDEIGDVALEVQPKLMRFLQEGEIQPLGETRPIKVDVRVIAATNSDLESAVEEGRFREDLFHRLNIIRIQVPALRERREEIPALASHFLERFASRSGKQDISFSQEAVDALQAYDWPGNVRQLRNEVERITAYAAESTVVSCDHLSPEVVNGSKRNRSARPVPGRPALLRDKGNYASSDFFGQSESDSSAWKLREAVAELETRLIRDALERNSNNLSRTAIDLGLSRRGLRLKLEQLGISRR